nr:zinc finger, CCHC-type [Tanacetum cinerariifolium]
MKDMREADVILGAISWVFKKQTCITGSTMESEFVALAVAGARIKRTIYVNMKFCRFKKLGLGFLKSRITLKWERFVGDFSVINGHLAREATRGMILLIHKAVVEKEEEEKQQEMWQSF